jgi:hypothetical protein
VCGDHLSLNEEPLPEGAAPGKTLSPEARRALEDAAERRKVAQPASPVPELGGPAGEEPTRFGDWERRGIVTDF